MNEHPIQGLMSTAMENIKGMVDVNTIVGDAVQAPDGSIIIPISKVGFGFVATGMEYGPVGKDNMFGGGSGGGVSIKPVAFLVVGQGQIKLLPVTETSSSMDKLLDFIPGVIDKVNGAIQKKKEDKSAKKTETEENAKEFDGKDQIIKPANS